MYYMVDHKINISKYQRTYIIPTPFSDNTVINLEINKSIF